MILPPFFLLTQGSGINKKGNSKISNLKKKLDPNLIKINRKRNQKKKSLVKDRCGATRVIRWIRHVACACPLLLSLSLSPPKTLDSTATTGYEASSSSSQPQRVNGNNAISHPISDKGLFFLHLRVQMGRWWWCFNGARSFQRHWP